MPSSLAIFLQGDVNVSGGVGFGDGVRCVGGMIKRLDVASASGGSAAFPGPDDLSITARSAALGDPIAAGSTRWYQDVLPRSRSRVLRGSTGQCLERDERVADRLVIGLD